MLSTKKSFKGYIRTTKAWYTHITHPLEVNFGIYYPEGKRLGELTMAWEKMGDRLTPRLCVFDDSWGVLAELSPFIKVLSKYTDMDISEEEFVRVLDENGFKDITVYVKPIE